MSKQRGCFGRLLLLILIAGAVIAAASMAPLSVLKNSVEFKLSETLGRRVTIDSVRLSLMGSPHLTITGMTAEEDAEFGEGAFLKASEVRAGVDVFQCLRNRRIVINAITLKSPRIDLIKNRDGVWSWTTLGKQGSDESRVSSLAPQAVSCSPILRLLSGAVLSGSSLRAINIERASVRLRDSAGPEPTEVIYKNIELKAALTPQPGGDSGYIRRVKGDLIVRSEEDGEADRLTAVLPFEIEVDGRGASALSVSGSIGPGPIETKNVSIGALAISGEINSNRSAPLTGKGRMSATDLDIHTVNLSERVASALKLAQIGDMNPGTAAASLETDFQISRGSVNTTGLRVEQLDGLGDAAAPIGSFKIDSALFVNYAATIALSPETTSRIKSGSPALGLLVTMLETNNRLSLPINVTGDVRNPEVQVDVSRIF